MLTDSCPVQWTGRRAVITLPAYIDASNAGQIREVLLSVINRGAEALIADLAATISCDDAGADAVVRANQRAVVSGTELRLVVTAQIVRRVLSFHGLNRLVPIYPSLEAATAARPPAASIPGPAAGPSGPAGPAEAITPAVLWKVVDALQDGVALTDGRGALALVNRRLEEMFGYAHAELIGRPVELLIPADLRAAHRGYRAAYARAPRARPMGAGAQLVGLRKDGTTFPAEISLSPVLTATGTLTLTVIRDVSEARGSSTSSGPQPRHSRPTTARNFSNRSSPACTRSGAACRPPRTCPTTRTARAPQWPSGTSTARSARSTTSHSPPAVKRQPRTVLTDRVVRRRRNRRLVGPVLAVGR